MPCQLYHRGTKTIKSVRAEFQSFFSSYKIGDLLRKCGAGKEKGVAIVQIFRYLVCLMFSDRSMYMQITTKRFKEDYSKNTVYRFLNNSRINWERFTTICFRSVHYRDTDRRRCSCSAYPRIC